MRSRRLWQLAKAALSSPDTTSPDCYYCCMADELDGRAKEARECRMRNAGVWDPGL